MKIMAATRANLQTFPAGVFYLDLRHSGVTIQVAAVNISSGIVRHYAVPVFTMLAIPTWLVVDDKEVVVIADVDALPGVEFIVRASDGSSRVLPESEAVWSIDTSTMSSDLASCVASLSKIGGIA